MDDRKQLTPAPAELIRLACATRKDLDPDDVQGAVLAACAALPWSTVLFRTVLMLRRGEEPRDLRNSLPPVTRQVRRARQERS